MFAPPDDEVALNNITVMGLVVVTILLMMLGS